MMVKRQLTPLSFRPPIVAVQDDGRDVPEEDHLLRTRESLIKPPGARRNAWRNGCGASAPSGKDISRMQPGSQCRPQGVSPLMQRQASAVAVSAVKILTSDYGVRPAGAVVENSRVIRQATIALVGKMPDGGNVSTLRGVNTCRIGTVATAKGPLVEITRPTRAPDTRSVFGEFAESATQALAAWCTNSSSAERYTNQQTDEDDASTAAPSSCSGSIPPISPSSSLSSGISTERGYSALPLFQLAVCCNCGENEEDILKNGGIDLIETMPARLAVS